MHFRLAHKLSSEFFFFWEHDFGSMKPQKTEREGAGARLVSLAGNRIK